MSESLFNPPAETTQLPNLPSCWIERLRAEFGMPYFRELREFVVAERKQGKVFPPGPDVFNAFRLTPFDRVSVVILGQDPYHDVGQAHGLAFSVQQGKPAPPSLVNIFAELKSDLGIPTPPHGYLEAWAKQGVLLLNTVLTVRAHQAASHQKRGWETFTDAVIREVNTKPEPVAFVLWGAQARKKRDMIDTRRHLIVETAHPSPLSARNGFFGSKPFSKINSFLKEKGMGEIDWRLDSKS